jgi:cytochrome c oxidase subunit 2
MGKRLVERNNCLGCHTTQGESNFAPTFEGLYGTVRELVGGATVSADAAYLRESIKRPNEKIVLGYFRDAMPTVFFNEAEIDAMVEYIKTLK